MLITENAIQEILLSETCAILKPRGHPISMTPAITSIIHDMAVLLFDFVPGPVGLIFKKIIAAVECQRTFACGGGGPVRIKKVIARPPRL